LREDQTITLTRLVIWGWQTNCCFKRFTDRKWTTSSGRVFRKTI